VHNQSKSNKLRDISESDPGFPVSDEKLRKKPRREFEGVD